MRHLSIVILLVFLCQVESSCQSDAAIEGEWKLALVQKSSEGSMAVECPDFVLISANGTYQVLNDCEYRDQNKDGIVEAGYWKLDRGSMILTFYRRDFLNKSYSEYSFHGRKAKLTFVVESLTETELVVCIDDGTGCIQERYERR